MEKYCPICNTRKSLDDFYVKRSAKDGRQPFCKECQKKKNRGLIEPTPTKVCRVCRCKLELSEFGPNPHEKDGLSTVCDECRVKQDIDGMKLLESVVGDNSRVRFSDVCEEIEFLALDYNDTQKYLNKLGIGTTKKVERCLQRLGVEIRY